MIIAAFAGGVAGVAVLFRMYANRVLGIFSKKHRAKADEHAIALGATPDTDE